MSSILSSFVDMCTDEFSLKNQTVINYEIDKTLIIHKKYEKVVKRTSLETVKPIKRRKNEASASIQLVDT